MDKNYIYLECDIGKTSIMKFLVDTGALISILKQESVNPRAILNEDNTTVNGVFSSGQKSEGYITARLRINKHNLY